MMRLAVFTLIVSANQRGKNSRQEHENERLNQANQQFHKIERNRQNRAKDSLGPRRVLHCIGKRFEQVFTGENISVKPEAQGNRAKTDRNDFEKADQKENDDHHVLNEPAALTLGAENV